MSSAPDMGRNRPGPPGTTTSRTTPQGTPGSTGLRAPDSEPLSHELELVGCPQCGGPAEVEWRHAIASTGGPMEHLRIRCVNRHWFLLTQESLDLTHRYR